MSEDIATIPAPRPGWLGWRGQAVRLFTNPIRHLMGLREQYGELVGLSDGRNPPLLSPELDGLCERTLFALGARANRSVLLRSNIFESHAPRQPSGAPQRLSNNVVFMNGDVHRDRRRRLLHGMTQPTLRSFHDDDVVRLCQQLLDGWQVGRTVDLFQEMRLLSLRVASQCFLGLAAGEGASSMAQDMRTAITMIFSPSTLIPIDLPGSPQWRLRRQMERIENGLLEEIARRRARDLGGNDLLSQFLTACDDGVVSPHELAGQAFILFFAGHDTTTCGLTWTLFLLAQHPEIAEAVRAEVRAELGDRLPSFEDLDRMVLLERVVKESLRLFPPGLMFGRIANQDTEILGCPVARGSEVLYSPYVTHRDPEVFAEPSRFLPSRWEGASVGEFEFLPFGTGARRCIGASFAMMELRSVLAQILQRFTVRVQDGLRIDALVNPILSPKQPLRVILEPADAPWRSATVRGQILEMLDLSPRVAT